MKKFEDYFLAFNRWALILILAAMSVIIFTNVVLRYTTNQSIEWAEEVARHMMIWLTFIGCGPVLRYGGHIAIDNLQDSMPTKAAQMLRVLIAVLVTAFCIFSIWFGIQYMDRTQYQITPATQISIAWIYLALPLGMGMTLIHWLLIVRSYIARREFASDAHFDATASASL
ncbi:TRAP transporter small permease [Limnohabitans sp. Jir72]|uniref:TRAP transporter small permease n=1 Tax=Limnohabitans sp. Jir72 TaxID=1977909 RepID=UPI000D3AA1B2|nr:TRAP transporter small permease [Limnohabitans sp. Jir72]PUE30608.1 C4-dicarboxylate ABC transporter permease [Limnohabitans sp. Jir72]